MLLAGIFPSTWNRSTNPMPVTYPLTECAISWASCLPAASKTPSVIASPRYENRLTCPDIGGFMIHDDRPRTNRTNSIY